MKFRTEYKASTEDFSIGHQAAILTIGSCFADHIGEKLQSEKFNVLINPFLPTYNPTSIFKQLKLVLTGEEPDPLHYLKYEEKNLHLDFHSKFNGATAEANKEAISLAMNGARQHIQHTKFVIITLGTAWYYVYKPTGGAVANCHKLPADYFEKRLFSPEEIVEKFNEMLVCSTPAIRYILTVSPVRHLKDGMQENSLSKAILRFASHEIVKVHKNVYYFPAYEILMDDLRDYRFYSDDLLHPTPRAVDYLWEKFSETYFSKNTRDILDKWEKISSAFGHKPFHPESQTHKDFLSKLHEDLKEISKKLPVEKELKQIENQLDAFRKA